MEFDFSKKITAKKLAEFAQILEDISETIGFKVSARGWCYIMEQHRYINKDQFDKMENAINRCRKEGLIPVDFVAEEDARAFSGIEEPDTRTMESILEWMLGDVLSGDKYYTPDWWEGEEYYIQILVEKIDLKTLFEPICREYHIPIANAKGWSSISQRAEYARRFKEAEERGLKCVLLYCGDYDPDGNRISDAIRKNLEQISEIRWGDGTDGYDPADLIIDRFGLNYDFIINNKFTWIDNLITGSGGELAKKLPNGEIVPGKTATGKPHQNFYMPYLQEYLKHTGVRKCEANAIVVAPKKARTLIRQVIEGYIGEDAKDRFQEKRDAVKQEYQDLLEESGLAVPINKFLDRD